MKKLLLFMVALVFVLSGCRGDTPPKPQGPGSEFLAEGDCETIYDFPEPTIQIKATRSCRGETREFVIGPDVYDITDTSVRPVMSWFSGLELEECKWAPKVRDKNAYYDFVVDGRAAFGYYEKGEKAFVFVGDKCYTVKNPSSPPLE